jgi:hypothetical protein
MTAELVLDACHGREVRNGAVSKKRSEEVDRAMASDEEAMRTSGFPPLPLVREPTKELDFRDLVIQAGLRKS